LAIIARRLVKKKLEYVGRRKASKKADTYGVLRITPKRGKDEEVANHQKGEESGEETTTKIFPGVGNRFKLWGGTVF